MWPVTKSELHQNISQDLEQRGLFCIDRHEAEETAAIHTPGFHYVQALELVDDAPGSHLQAILAHLSFQ